jgi:hypothetical protein
LKVLQAFKDINGIEKRLTIEIYKIMHVGSLSNPLVISIIAVGISILSFSIVAIDKIKSWRQNSKIKRLKYDKSILQPLIVLKAESFSESLIVKHGTITTELSKPHSSRLYNLFQSIDTKKLKNKSIALKIERIKNLSDTDLIKSKGNKNGTDYSQQFTQIVNEVITESKMYLAEII